MKFLTALLAFFLAASALFATEPLYTVDLITSSEGHWLMAQKGRQSIEERSDETGELLRSISLKQSPTGLVRDAKNLYVTTFEEQGMLEVFDLATGKPLWQIELASGACSPVLSPDGATLYVCNQFAGNVMGIDLASKTVKLSVKLLREPKNCVLTDGGRYLYVANFLPHMAATEDHVAACVSIVDVTEAKLVRNIELANGSNALRGIALSPDGLYVYVTHNLGRYTVPTSQLQQGWMNTSAFSVIATKNQEYLGTIIVDEPELGAAGIWDIDCDADFIYITHSGTHELSRIRQSAMLERLLKYEDNENLAYDLRFLYGLRDLLPLEGNGPRNLLLSKGKIVVPSYFSDHLNIADARSLDLKMLEINPERTETAAQKGEKYFNDARLCFQRWQSCNGCHPGDARTDGMNWDLLNDGVGNPKNCKSMLFSHETAPSMITGVRVSAELAVRKGFTHIQFYQVDEEYALCVDEYLKGLRPVASPYLVKGELSESAQRGKKIFEERHCGFCHSGPMFTDRKMHDIGEDVEFEEGWDTPTLREVWRTAPYLFDGRAATMKDVFLQHKHAIRGEITPEEAQDLSNYVLSL